MALMEFFGCMFIAFGPAMALFIFTIIKDPLKIIIFVASAFFWLMSLLLSSLWWFAVVPLRKELAFGVMFSVALQELFRLFLCMLLKKAEEGFRKALGTQSDEGEKMITLFNSKHSLSYVCGLGFGTMSGAFSLVNVLRDLTGPGTVGIRGGGNHQFFLMSALLTSAFVLLHVFWAVLFHDGYLRRSVRGTLQICVVFGTHFLASGLTLIPNKENRYAVVLVPIYCLVLIMGFVAFYVAEGRLSRLITCFRRGRANLTRAE